MNKHVKNLIQQRESIWAEQQSYFKLLLAQEAQYGSQDMICAAQDQVLAGGKRIRAFLPMYIYKYFKGVKQNKVNKKEEESAKWLGLCCELLHSATLCHDDIMDGDKTRRNAPTIWAKYGIPQAINLGDYLIFMCQETVHKAKLLPAREIKALQALTRLSRRLVHGQALEFELKRLIKLPEAKSYKQIVAGKTGGLFALCLVFGGIVAKVTDKELKALEKLGMSLGEIFQIQDDINDLLGNKGRDLAASDLWEGKPSWLIAQTANRLNLKEQKLLLQLLYLPREEKKQIHIQKIYTFIEKSGALAQAEYFLSQINNINSPIWREFKGMKTLIELLMKMLQSQMPQPRMINHAA